MPKCEPFEFMNLKDQGIHVELQPAKTKDFQMVRANLIPVTLFFYTTWYKIYYFQKFNKKNKRSS